MAVDIVLPIIGIVFFIFRLWLSTFKLKDELQFRRFYVSRLVNYFFCFSIIFNFKNPVFNVILAVCFPAMVFTSMWDFNFYRHFKGRTYWKKNKTWLLLERMTMHPPILIGGLYIYLTGIWNYVPPGDLVVFAIGILFVYPSSYFLDVRLRKRYEWPNGRDLLLVMLFSTVAFSMYYIFY
ncbi:MAG: hypothetical protein EU533_01350 [Promethearchaeota archaeon]|nr:MAG: hypothetical protein EU533_01350 [Candidatus Lokiarchaeota archaeon]